MDTVTTIGGRSIPWNKGKLLGQKPPPKLKEIWAALDDVLLEGQSAWRGPTSGIVIPPYDAARTGTRTEELRY